MYFATLPVLLIAVFISNAVVAQTVNPGSERPRIVKEAVTVQQRIVRVPDGSDRRWDDHPISGPWDAVYVDDDLGPVPGRAVIDEETGTATVTYQHPRAGEDFELKSTSFRRVGNKVIIEFEGRGPILIRDNGQDFPQIDLIVPEDTRQFKVTVGENEIEKEIAPRPESDQDFVTLELTFTDAFTLTGEWHYRADPFTRRDTLGNGRVGDCRMQEDGSAVVKGSETWTQPRPTVLGAFALEDQKGWSEILNEAFYPHPFQNDKFQGKQARRSLFIFGADLYDGRHLAAELVSGSEFVEFGREIYPDSTFKSIGGFLEPFEAGRKKLRPFLLKELEPHLHASIDELITKLDFVVVEATLKDGVLPGLQPFSIGDSENTWILSFGNNRADIRFVREIDPNKIHTRKTDSFGFTIKHTDQSVANGSLTIEIAAGAVPGESQDAIVEPGQTIQGDIYETRTYTRLPDTIEKFQRWGMFPRFDADNVEGSPIVTNPGTYEGRHGTLVLKRDGKFDYQAKPVRVDSDRFEATGDAFIPETVQVEIQTELDLGVDVINVSIGKDGKVQKIGSDTRIRAWRTPADARVYRTEPIRLVGSGTDLPVQHDDVLLAAIADPGLVSVTPPPASLDVHTTPARFPLNVSYLWKDHLKSAAACYPELTEIDWDRSNYDFVAETSRDLNFKWSRLLNPITLLLPAETLTVNFQLGDHAAMLMMRQAFIQALGEKMEGYRQTAIDDDSLRAYWTAMSPYRWNPTIHPITDTAFDIKVTGSEGSLTAFWETYWGEDGKARRYEDPGDIPDWIVSATRDAIVEYIKILSHSLKIAQDVDTCKVEELVKLTGNTFEDIDKRLNPRLMRLADTTAASQEHAWVPDYHARLRVDQVASKFWQVKQHAKIADEDTQYVIAAYAIMAAPVAIVGGLPAMIIIGVTTVVVEAGHKYPKYAASAAEIEFARGTVDVLGYGRYLQAKVDEYSIYDYGFDIWLVAAMELAGDAVFENVIKVLAAPFRAAVRSARSGLKVSKPVLNKAVLSFRKGILYVRAERGARLLEQYGFDISRVPANLKTRDYMDMMEYVFRAGRLRAANGVLDDHQLEVLRVLDDLAERARLRPRWKEILDEATYNDLKDLLSRRDIDGLMRSARSTVINALRAGGRTRDEALTILRYSPQTTGEDFQRLLDHRLNLKREPPGYDVYNMTAETQREIVRILSRAKWFFNIVNETSTLDTIKIHAPGGAKDKLNRFFDENTGVLFMKSAFREEIPSHIAANLPHKLSEKGFPAFLFAQLRYMNRAGIGYAGQEGTLLRRVQMQMIVNARTHVQLAWFRKTYYPTKTFEEMAEEGLLDEFLLHTRSVDYARSVINMAGYRVKSVRLKLYGPGSPLKDMEEYFKVAKDAETWDEFLTRHGFKAEDEGPPGFDIVIEVEPHPVATRRMAANDNVPPNRSGTRTGTDEGVPTNRSLEETWRDDGVPTRRDGSGSGGDGSSGGGPPNDGPPPRPASTTGGEEPDYMETLRRLQDQMAARVQQARDRYVRGVEDGTELMPETADAFAEVADQALLLQTFEETVAEARRLGLPDDLIARRVEHYDFFDTHQGRLEQVNRLRQLMRHREGARQIDFRQARDLSMILGRLRAGTMTDDDLAVLRRYFQDAADQGNDFIDELERMYFLDPEDPTSDPLVFADTIPALRELAERENLYQLPDGPDDRCTPYNR